MKAQDMRMGNAILGVLEGLWEQTQSMDSGIRVTTCKTGDRRLLVKVFEAKPIKRGVKSHFDRPRNHSNSKSTPTNKCLSKTQTTTIPQHPLPLTHMSHENSTIWIKPK